MDENQKALLDYFSRSWKKMVELLGHARSTEFLIRISSELLSQKEFIEAKTWEEFNCADRKFERKKLDEHIGDLWGEESERLKLAKQCADKLAHADYLGAKNRIDAYRDKFGLNTSLNTDSVQVMSVNRIMHEDGKMGSIKYVLKSSKKNLTLEEYMVFEGQGYAEAAIEILQRTRDEIKKLVPNLPMKCSSLVLSRGLRFGQRC